MFGLRRLDVDLAVTVSVTDVTDSRTSRVAACDLEALRLDLEFGIVRGSIKMFPSSSSWKSTGTGGFLRPLR